MSKLRESDTPLTDAMIYPLSVPCLDGEGRVDVVHVDDCRALERKLNALMRGEFICRSCGLRKDAEKVENQCDGCVAGIPVDANGLHRMGSGEYPDYMACQRGLYDF